MDNNKNKILYNIEEMDLTKLSKKELLEKCEEHGFTKCKSKNKCELIDLINSKISKKSQIEFIIKEEDNKEIYNSDLDTFNEIQNEIILQPTNFKP